MQWLSIIVSLLINLLSLGEHISEQLHVVLIRQIIQALPLNLEAIAKVLLAEAWVVPVRRLPHIDCASSVAVRHVSYSFGNFRVLKL